MVGCRNSGPSWDTLHIRGGGSIVGSHKCIIALTTTHILILGGTSTRDPCEFSLGKVVRGCKKCKNLRFRRFPF